MSRVRLVLFSASAVIVLVLIAGIVAAKTAVKDSIYKYLTVFAEVTSLVKSNYVEPVTSKQLMQGAFSGLTEAMDPFSYYVAKQDLQRYRQYLDQEDPGVGLVIAKRFGFAYVISPIDSSPAFEAGVKPGDFIQAIDGKPTRDMDLWQIRAALRGKEGSKVTVSLVTESFMKKAEKVLARRQVFTPDPTLRMRGAVGILRIPYFGQETSDRVKKLLQEASSRKVKKLLVDLRDNPGGVTEEAVEVARYFLKSGRIASLKGRKGPNEEWSATSGKTVWDGELAVLVNYASAQAPEVLAAALRDNDKATLIGETTYGKGVVQRYVKLNGGGAVYLTVAKYYTPAGKMLQGNGVKPDVEVDAVSLEDSEEKTDRVLEKGLELLNAGKIAEKRRAAA